MMVPAGYKVTEVGVIPTDWQVLPLQDTCREQITYGIVQCGPHVEGGVPYIRVSDMDTADLHVEAMLRTSAQIASKFARSRVEPGDIVYALRGKLGEVRLVPTSLAGANLTQGTARLAPKPSISGQFLLWSLRHPRAVRRAVAEAKGTTFIEITLADLRRVPVAVPGDRPEQTAIATALNDVDALITSLEKLLAKKRDLKQAAMQRLLTGKERLPGFGGEWRVLRLGDLVDRIVGGGTPSRSTAHYWGPDVPWVTVKDLSSHDPGRTEEYISFEGLRNCAASLVPAGTLLVGARMSPGRAVIYDIAVAVNQDLKALFLKANNSVKFLYYWFSLHLGAISELASGSTVKGISTNQLRSLPVRIGQLPEQTAIANILTSMDTDIATVETRLTKTRALKAGMMQELLTGRIRLL